MFASKIPSVLPRRLQRLQRHGSTTHQHRFLSSSGIKREYAWAEKKMESVAAAKSAAAKDKEDETTTTTTTTTMIMSNVIQGPSLLLTTLDRPSPTMMMLPGLRSLPFWTDYDSQHQQTKVAYQDPTVSKVVQHLESQSHAIQEEYQRVAPSLTSDYDSTSTSTSNNGHDVTTLHHGGSWDWYSYMLQGKVQSDFVTKFPITTGVLQELHAQDLLFTDTPFGFCFFSNLSGGGSQIEAHSSPINYRLRIHLPLIVPKGSKSTDDDTNDTTKPNDTKSTNDIGIRVGPLTKSWIPHQAMVLDDSYNHEVWNHTDEERVVLLVDIWHPDVRPTERIEIKRMFHHATQQGWIGK